MPKWMAGLELQTAFSGHSYIYCKKYKYPTCIPQQEHHLHPDLLTWAWYTPTLEDFNILPTAAFIVRKLNEEKAVGIATLLNMVLNQYATWKMLQSLSSA